MKARLQMQQGCQTLKTVRKREGNVPVASGGVGDGGGGQSRVRGRVQRWIYIAGV